MQPVEQALDAALIVMRNGGSTEVADRVFANLLTGDPNGFVALWRLDCVTAIPAPSGGVSPLVRAVGPIGVNLVRAGEAVALSERVARGDISPAAVNVEIARIAKLPTPYNRWILILAAAVATAAFSQILGGDRGSLVVVAVAAAIGQLFRSTLQTRGLSAATVTLVAALISACVATLGLRLGYSQVPTATVVASIIYMVPGLPLINGFVDVVSHKYLMMGIERIANAVFLFLVLAVAVVMALTAVL